MHRPSTHGVFPKRHLFIFTWMIVRDDFIEFIPTETSDFVNSLNIWMSIHQGESVNMGVSSVCI